MKKIAAFTSTRADYGLLFHLMKSLELSPDCEFHMLITGTHLSEKHGYTGKLIDRTLFKNIHELPVPVTEEPYIFAETVKQTTELLKKQNFDSCIVLGDRFEAFGFATACFMENIPLIHLHGGEVTYGAKDDSYRHCITKLARLHFTAHPDYSKRVIQLGEEPSSVFNVGPLGLEYLKTFKKKSKAELSELLKFDIGEKSLLITVHPETHSLDQVDSSIKMLLECLGQLKDVTLIFTMPNIDPGGEIIRNHINDFCQEKAQAQAFENLGSDNYLSVMSVCDGVVGNSSSGIYEAPYLKVPTLNIGDRQTGRIKATSVIDVDYDKNQIRSALERILGNQDTEITNPVYPFGEIDSYLKVRDIILTYTFEKFKKFYDKN